MRWLAVDSVVTWLGCASASPPPPYTASQPKIAAEPPRPLPSPRPPEAPSFPLTSPVESVRSGAVETPLALPALSAGDIGGAGPLELLAASPSGSWVAVCQGDPRSARLILGSGPGEAIERLEATDPSGRFVVVTQDGTLRLIDAVSTGHVDLTALGADARRVRTDYATHRSLGFDALGTKLAYARGVKRPEVVVRDLSTGAERVFALGAGELYRLRFSADARYVELEVLRDDTNKNGKLDWPAPEEVNRAACGGQRVPQFRSFGYQGRGDSITRAVIDLTTGSLRDVPALVTTLGRSLLVRESDGSLQLDTDGKRSRLVPASCAARVVFADAERGLVLATCVPPKKKGKSAPAPNGKAGLWLFGAGTSKNLEVELYETAVDRDSTIGARLTAIYPGSAAALLDLDRGELISLAFGSRVLSTAGARALIWREDELFVFDAATKAEQRIARGVSKVPDLLRAGRTVLLSPFIVLEASGPALEAPLGALAVASSGHALVPASSEGPTGPAPDGAIQGPLHWVDARLRSPDGPPR